MAYITITGNLTKDPVLKTSGQGKPYARFTVAWSERVKENGEWTDGPAMFVGVSCFGSTAENVAISLAKGNRVTVSGELKPETWARDTGPETVLSMAADEVSVSLKWHVARPEKPGMHERVNQFTQQQGGQQQSDPWNSAPQPQGGFSGGQDAENPPW